MQKLWEELNYISTVAVCTFVSDFDANVFLLPFHPEGSGTSTSRLNVWRRHGFFISDLDIGDSQVPRVIVWEYFCIPDICIFCTPPLYENLCLYRYSLRKLCSDPFRALCGLGKSTLLPVVMVVAHISF